VPKLGRKSKIIVGLVVALAVMLISGLFFPVSRPEVHLAANYHDPFIKLGPIWITNTLIASWLSIVVLIGLFWLGTRKMKLVPRRFQGLVEFVIETLLNFVESVAGRDNGRRFFPIVATIFLYVLMNAWLGLLPIFNFIGTVDPHALPSPSPLFPGEYSGTMIHTSLFRAANTDINLPLMLALVSFFCVEYWGVTSLGFRHYVSKFVRAGRMVQGFAELAKGRVKAALGNILFGFIDLFVGALEAMGEFVRIISFTFRLFGNMMAGEILLLMMAFLIPWLLASIFYGLETLLGFIQALIFSALTLVFATMAVMPHEQEH